MCAPVVGPVGGHLIEVESGSAKCPDRRLEWVSVDGYGVRFNCGDRVSYWTLLRLLRALESEAVRGNEAGAHGLAEYRRRQPSEGGPA